jgi:hypothetical protein
MDILSMAIDARLWKWLTGYMKVLCHVPVTEKVSRETLRQLLTGGHRRSIAQSNQARALVAQNPDLIADIARLLDDEDWLVSQRALDLLEKFAHDHPDWVEPYKQASVGLRRKRFKVETSRSSHTQGV